MKIGYARVSTSGQSLDSQLSLLKEFGCEEIITEKLTGNDLNRKGLQDVLGMIRKDDVLAVSKLDRLGRNLKDILVISEDIKAKNASLCILDLGIETETEIGSLMITILEAVAEFETNIRKERQAEGIIKAKKKGVYKGRSPLNEAIVNQIKILRQCNMSIRNIAKELNVSPSSIQKYIY